MNAQSKYSGLRGMALMLMLAALVFGGLGITGAAAQSAIPGDTLYSVKSTIEQTRLSLARDAGDRAELRLGFAEQRLEELQALIEEGRFREVNDTVLAFEEAVHGAILELETVSRLDPDRAGQIALEITSDLSSFAQTLSRMQIDVPEGISQEMQRALDTTQIAENLDLTPAGLLGDDNGNDNANVNGDDNANINEDQNGNVNGDDDANVNADDNSNENDDSPCVLDSTTGANTNGDDSCSPNENANVNGDDSSTGNDNSSVDSGKTNTDDHGGSDGSGGSGGGGGSEDGGSSGKGSGGG